MQTLECRRSCVHAQGDILEDIALIENLEETKRTALEIAEKVVLAKETGISLSQAREVHSFLSVRMHIPKRRRPSAA